MHAYRFQFIATDAQENQNLKRSQSKFNYRNAKFTLFIYATLSPAKLVKFKLGLKVQILPVPTSCKIKRA